MFMARLPRDEPGEAVVATAHEVQVEVVRQRATTVGSRCCIEQRRDLGDVVVVHVAFDLEAPHRSNRIAAFVPVRTLQSVH